MKWHLKHAVHGNKPWDVQVEAQRRSEGKARFGYWLQMGLGKTALTLNDFVDSNYERALVLAPNSFKIDWALAPEEWGVGEEIVSQVWPVVNWTTHIQRRDKRALISMNYEAVRSDRGHAYAQAFMDAMPTMLIIDESSAIKGFKSDTTKAVLDLCRRSAMVRELNGTPIVQNVLDYWAQLKAVGELDGVNPFSFRNRFAVMGGFMGKQIVGMKNEEELFAILDRCSFRALTEDWRSLPPKRYATVHLEMTAKQRKHYQAMLEEFFTEVGGMEVSADMVLAQMNKLRQISSCLVMQDGAHEWIEEPKNNPKFKAVLDLVGDYGKAIVSYFYRPTGDALFEALTKAKLQPAYIKGGMKPEAISQEKKRFNGDPECRVIIGQVGSISRGHTLLGQPGKDRCNKLIVVENSFERLHRAHLEDRNHRGEQDQPCVVYDLSTSPMDDAGIEILLAKKNMADDIDKIVAVARREHRGRA